MSDAVPLPARPNLEQYKKLAKDLQHACKPSDPGAIREWAARWAPAEAERIERRWRQLPPTDCRLSSVQFFVARVHGFRSWPVFSKHLQELASNRSPVSRFEAAADAIVSGDNAALSTLLLEDPGLVCARSTREHRSTLLHYVSANGIEDFRQKTPANIVEVARLLLLSGADVNAESDAYNGRSTTLMLAATSCHPERAGVQIPLMQLLLEHGAAIGADGVNVCLHNGRGRAAEFLANRGASLDLEGSAGVGRLDIVESCFSEAKRQQLADGFAWACEFGRTDVVEFLLRKGIEPQTKLRRGQTGLHWAALEGHGDIVRMLLDHGAAVDIVEEAFGGTPLGWALHGWSDSAEGTRYYEAVAMLVRAGARTPAEYSEKIRSEPRMMAALRGEFQAADQ